MKTLISFENVSREYGEGLSKIKALDNVSFSIEEGEFVVILGPSGAGKSTLLNLLGGMDLATSGRIQFGTDEISQFNDTHLTQYRAEKIGFIFQFYNLIPNLTAYENVSITKEISTRALNPDETLEKVGLHKRKNNFPPQLSGGEQQRVAIARAINKNPDLLLCDEPTGALDSETGANVLSLLQQLCFESGRTIILVTHNSKLSPLGHRVLQLRDGKLLSNETQKSPMPAQEVTW